MSAMRIGWPLRYDIVVRQTWRHLEDGQLDIQQYTAARFVEDKCPTLLFEREGL